MLRRLRSDNRGAAAVEFSLIAPLMIAIYCGLAELALGMMAERRASHSASVVADLVAQSSSVSTSDMTDIFNVGRSIMTPFPSSGLKMRVSSITVNASGTPKVDWSQPNGLSALGVGSTATGMPGMLAVGDSVIVAEMSYTFNSPLKIVLPTALTFNSSYLLRPRRSSQVALTP